MRIFWFYEFNQSGVIDRAHDLRLASEDHARAYADTIVSPWPVEVWGDNRRIASIVPRRLQQAA